MRVRVYDREKDKYFKSEVFAVIDYGWYVRYLVLEPADGKAMMTFVEGIRKEEPDHPTNINKITPDIPQDWVCIKGEALPLLKKELNEYGADLRFEYHGYSWLLNDKRLLALLINGNTIDLDDVGHSDKSVCSKLAGWNYVDTQADVKTLMDAYGGFHDSCLTRLEYVSGAKVYQNHSMMPLNDVRQVTMFLGSQCCDGIEMVFEGVTEMNLRPAQDNHESIIYGATLLVRNEEIYFCGGYKADPDSYDGTWIKAFSLRWRLLPLTD